MKIPGVPGFEVCVRCEGANLQEYHDEADGDRYRSAGVKYVEATSGANFAISFRADPLQMNNILDSQVDVSIGLDGKAINGKVYDIHRKRISYHEVVGRGSNIKGLRVLQRYTFADLELNEDQTTNIKKENVKHLGEIQVELRWVRRLGTSLRRHRPIEANTDESIPEKCLKGRAISNKATLGEAEHISGAGSGKKVDVVYTHGRMPFATFVFKYRSRKDLQIEGVTEASPEPEPLEDQDIKNMNPQETQALIQDTRAKEREREMQIKSEKCDHAALGEDEPRETTSPDPRESKRRRQSSYAGVEVIDLTEE